MTEVVSEPAHHSSDASSWSDLSRDAFVCALVGAVTAWSPVTTANRLPFSIAGGVAVAIALFGYRRWSAKARAEALDSAVPSDLPDAKWLYGGVALIALCIVPTLPDLLPFFTESVWRNCHGLFVPLLMLGMTRAVLRREALDPSLGSAGGGAVLLGVGIGLMILDLGVRTLHVSVIGLTFAAAGMVFLFFGWKGVKALAGPIALLLFLMPIPSALGAPLNLPTTSAVAAEGLLRLFDFSVLRRGWILDTPTFSFAVSVRCGGWGLFYAALALALALGTAAGSWRRGLMLAALAWPVTVLANGIRLAGLFAYCEWRNVGAAQTPVHGFSGILAFLIVVGILLLLGGRRARQELLAF